jgi:hypothetical protein
VAISTAKPEAKNMNNRAIVVAALAATLTLGMSATAFAQDGASGSVSTSTPPVVTSTGGGPVGAAGGGGGAAKVDDNTPDHERYIGRFAVGYFGVSQLPIANVTVNNGGFTLAPANVNAPVIGVRYWLSRMIGIDGGIGLGLTSGSTETVNGGTTTTTDHPSAFGAALHGGVPIALAHGKHYTFLAIPELNVGFTSGTIKGVGNPAPPDIDLSGFRFDLGGRIGAEIHFGFIGLPELSLEGSVGLAFHRTAYKAKSTNNGTTVSASDGTTSFGTNVQADPWALFVNNIAAFYYF